MATKKKKITLDALADKLDTLLERSAQLTEDVTVLEAGVADIKTDVRTIHLELARINKRLDVLENGIGDMRGYAKEIDGLRDRIGAIEKHLGITHKIQA